MRQKFHQNTLLCSSVRIGATGCCDGRGGGTCGSLSAARDSSSTSPLEQEHSAQNLHKSQDQAQKCEQETVCERVNGNSQNNDYFLRGESCIQLF